MTGIRLALFVVQVCGAVALYNAARALHRRYARRRSTTGQQIPARTPPDPPRNVGGPPPRAPHPMLVSDEPNLAGAPAGTPGTIAFDPACLLGPPVVLTQEVEVRQPELLTDVEHDVVDRLGGIWNDLCTIVERGPSRDDDLAELCALIHGLQRAVLKNAAARAYPDRYRLLGSVVGRTSPWPACVCVMGQPEPCAFCQSAKPSPTWTDGGGV